MGCRWSEVQILSPRPGIKALQAMLVRPFPFGADFLPRGSLHKTDGFRGSCGGIVRGREASVPFRSPGLRPSLGADASGSVSVMPCYRTAHAYSTRRSGRFSGGGVDRRPESAVVQFALQQRAAAQPRTAHSLTAAMPSRASSFSLSPMQWQESPLTASCGVAARFCR